MGLSAGDARGDNRESAAVESVTAALSTGLRRRAAAAGLPLVDGHGERGRGAAPEDETNEKAARRRSVAGADMVTSSLSTSGRDCHRKRETANLEAIPLEWCDVGAIFGDQLVSASATSAIIVKAPAMDLAARIEGFWVLQGNGQARHSFHEFFADGSANLILRLSSSGCRAVLLGPVTTWAAVERDQRAEYLGLRFRLGQAPALTDASAAGLTNSCVDLSRIGTIHVDDLAERLLNERDPSARQRFLEQLVRPLPFLVRSARARKVASVVDCDNGALRIPELATRLDVGVRSLERLCLAELGIAPKRLQRIVRLRRALWLLHTGGHGTLARVARACGYTDQSHLVKDFKAFTGRMPGGARGFVPRPIDGTPCAEVVHRYHNHG